MSILDSERLKEALQFLGEIFDQEELPPAHLYVVGGAALLAIDLSHRGTYDVDVLALREVDGEVRSAQPLPEELLTAADRVAKEFRLKGNWLNTGAVWVTAPLECYPAEF